MFVRRTTNILSKYFVLKVLKLNDYSDIKLPHWPQVLFGSNKVPTSHQHQHVFGPEHALSDDASWGCQVISVIDMGERRSRKLAVRVIISRCSSLIGDAEHRP